MKKIILFVFAICCLVLLSCDSGSGSKEPSSYQTSWTISGTIEFSGYFDNTDIYPVKFAAFFIENDATFGYEYPIVSSEIILLGNAASSTAESIPFTMNISSNSINETSGDEIVLGVWLDKNNNDIYDVGDGYRSDEAKPVNSGCTTFGDTKCNFAYYAIAFDGSIAGWNVDRGGTDMIGITSSNRTFSGVTITDGGVAW